MCQHTSLSGRERLGLNTMPTLPCYEVPGANHRSPWNSLVDSLPGCQGWYILSFAGGGGGGGGAQDRIPGILWTPGHPGSLTGLTEEGTAAQRPQCSASCHLHNPPRGPALPPAKLGKPAPYGA